MVKGSQPFNEIILSVCICIVVDALTWNTFENSTFFVYWVTIRHINALAGSSIFSSFFFVWVSRQRFFSLVVTVTKQTNETCLCEASEWHKDTCAQSAESIAQLNNFHKQSQWEHSSIWFECYVCVVHGVILKFWFIFSFHQRFHSSWKKKSS